MVRKGGIAISSNQYQRPETAGRVCKTPVVVLERLNIPLNSTILVKGNSIIFSVDLPSRNSHENDVIDISGSDNSEDEEFQKLIVKRFQSTRDNNSTCKQTESFHKFESVSFKQESSETVSSLTSKTYNYINSVKPGPASHKKLIAQTNALKRKSMQMSNTSRSACKYDAHKKQILVRNNAKKLLESESAEKILEQKIESAGFLNMSSTNKETAVSDKISSVVNDNTNASSSSFSAGKKTQSNKKTNNKKFLSVEQLDTSSSVQTTSIDVQERLTTPSMLEKNVLPNENIGANSNKQTPGHDQTVSPGSKPDFTPSRTSERIKNKKVKFSALRLLAGGDFQAMKRELNSRKHSTPKKTLVKANDSDAASINANNSEISPPVSDELLSTLSKPVSESKGNKLSPKIVSNTKPEKPKAKKVSTTTKGISGNRKQRLTKHSQDKLIDGHNLTCNEKVPDEQRSHDVLRSDEADNLSGVTESRLNGSKEILMKSSTEVKEDNINLKRVSDKIKIQLKGAPEKKIVNISVTPAKEFLKTKDSRTDELKQKLDLELGPDIIIRRVRSEKKQISEGGEESSATIENGKDKAASKDKVNTEETMLNKNLLMPNNLRIKNLIYSKQSTKSGSKSIKEVEVPPQIKKLLVEASKNKKSSTPKNKVTSTTKINQLRGSSTEDSGLNSRRKKKLNELHKKKLKLAKQKPMNKSKIEMLKNKGKNNLESRKDSEEQSASVQEMEHDDIEPEISELLDSTVEDDDVIKECEAYTKKSSSGDNKVEENKNNFKNTDTLSTNVGKKTAKVTPLRQAIKIPPKSDITKKPISDKMKNSSESEYIKFQKSNTTSKSDSPTDISILGSKSNYRNAFEKYFICSDKICEHNESLDSDSSCEVIDFLSHFVDIKRKDKEENEDCEDIIDTEDTSRLESNNEDPNDKNQVGINLFSRITEEKTSNSLSNKGKGTINEIIKGVTADLPRWNWHILPESSMVCLILLDREPNGTLDVKKCIELDSNFKAKVYVNKELVNEYCGVYDSFDAIKNLIYQVDLL